MIYKPKENASTDSETRKKEDEEIDEKLLAIIDMEDKHVVKMMRLGRKTDEDTSKSLLVSLNFEQDVIETNQKIPKLKETKIRNLRISLMEV